MDDIQQLFKDALCVVKDKTIMELLKNDKSYRRSLEKHSVAEKRYFEIKHTLTAEQQSVIEELLYTIQSNDTDMNDLLYMAGMRDMYHVLQSYDLLKN